MNIKIRHNVSNISKDGNLPGKEIYSSPLLKIITPTSGECSDHQLYHTCYHSCELSFFLRIYFVATVMANCCNHFHSPGTLLMGRGLGPSRAIKVLSGKELYFLYLMRQMVLVEFFIKKPWWSSFHTCEHNSRALDPRWDTTHLVTGAADNTVRLWDIQTGKRIILRLFFSLIKSFSRQGVELHPDEVCSENLWIFLLWKHGVLHH